MTAATSGARATAAYHRVYLVLRQRLLDQEFLAGVPIPSENSLAEEFGVSRVTIRRALELLHREHRIIRRQGVGNFPAPGFPDGAPDPPPKPGVGHLITLTQGTRARELSCETIPAPPRAREALRLPEGASCLRLRRLRLLEGQPFSLTALYLPTTIAKQIDVPGLDGAPVVLALEAAGLGPKRAVQMLSATLADAEVVAQLGGVVGAPVMRLRRTVFDPSECPLLYQESLYLPQHFELRMELSRNRSDSGVLWQPSSEA